MTEGRGTPPGDGAAVFVNWVDRDTGDWEAVWQDGFTGSTSSAQTDDPDGASPRGAGPAPGSGGVMAHG